MVNIPVNIVFVVLNAFIVVKEWSRKIYIVAVVVDVVKGIMT